MLENYGFAAVFAAPTLAGLRHLARIEAEGHRYGSPKNGRSETVWQSRAAKVRRCCGEIAALSDHT